MNDQPSILFSKRLGLWVRQPVRFPSEEPHSKLLLRSSLLWRETMPAQSSMDFLTKALALAKNIWLLYISSMRRGMYGEKSV